ncbi:TetR/AcrR family transcriptional regulator [Dactylosporangium sp. NPDC050688]|uniref:TetR/AcrR family transcriptional regulator n=1 Tax=Dactylosporangium sp. NPDC050688 TaxID=3157217 RepID=UPI0033DD5A32
MTSPRGRPRQFDRDVALGIAVEVFWARGYEATSINDLATAIGIGVPSLYAAFGSKRALFEEVVAEYTRRHAASLQTAIDQEPTLTGAVRRLLLEAAAASTRPGLPRGDLIVSAAVNTTAPEVEQLLRKLRVDGTATLEALIARAVAAGELPAGTDAHGLAHYVSATLQGIAQQARDGADRATLEKVAALAMRAWPAGTGD